MLLCKFYLVRILSVDGARSGSKFVMGRFAVILNYGLNLKGSYLSKRSVK